MRNISGQPEEYKQAIALKFHITGNSSTGNNRLPGTSNFFEHREMIQFEEATIQGGSISFSRNLTADSSNGASKAMPTSLAYSNRSVPFPWVMARHITDVNGTFNLT